jgi:hypothetical protein
MLTEEQREAANRAAEHFIEDWERRYQGAETLFGY